MKYTRLLLSIVYLMLMSTIYAVAQQYPVQVITQLLPPYTLNVPQWYNGMNEKLVVLLTNQDMNRLTQVRLRLRIEGSGVRITSRQGAFYPIINLDSGVPVRLSLNDLAPYFKPENLNFESGISYANYVKSYTLPEGFYFICFEAVEVFSGQVVGRGQCGQAYISLNDPPFLNMPRKGESILHRDPTNITFQWTPRHMSDPYLAFNTEYEFTMVELLDNGMVPDAAFAINRPAFHPDRCPTSTYVYGPDKPLLTPGRRYAWRICVKSNDGSNLSSFKNQGCSEVYWFTYQNDCLPPINIQAEAMSVAARITWTPVMASQNGTGLGGTYKVDYREYKMSPTDWQSTNSSTNRVTLDKLDPDRSYEYRVGRSCDDNLTYVYSDIKRFKTNVEVTRGDCTAGGEPAPITNREPIQTLHAGDVITAGGGSPIRITQVSGQGEFTGYGYGTISLLGHAQFKVKFANIVVNTDKQLIGGFIESTYDKDEKQIADLDRKIEGGKTTAVLQTKADTTDYTIPFKISGPEAIEITSDASAENNVDGASGAKLSIKNPDGSIKEIQVSKLPATINDQNNTVYKIEQGKDGKAIVTKVGQQEQSKPNPTLANSTANSSIKASVQFKNYPEKQRYAFDEYQAAYSKSMLYKPKYEALVNNYFVSHKAIVEGQTDVIKAVLTTDDKTMVADSVRFVNHQGFRYTSKIIAPNTFEVTIKGGTGGQTQELYATYPDGKKFLSLGKLLITSYNTQQRKVVLVPVNNASVDRGAISQKLNNIYNPIGIQFEVSQDASLDDMSWDTNGDGKLAVKGSGLFSTLTPEMKALNQVYSQSRSVQADAVYLFILPSADEVVAGDMPRGKQFGYLFSGDDGRVAAHEIGHGLFKLKHTFDGYGFAKGELSNNLMDYPAGDQLTKYQWDQVRDPGMVIPVFEKEEDGELAAAEQAKNIASVEKQINFCETDTKYYKGMYDGVVEGGKDAFRLLTTDGLTDFAKGLCTLVWHWNPINWSNESAEFRTKMLAQLGSTLKKMVITDDCYESGKLWGHTIIGIFGAEGLVAVGKGAIKLGELASVSANRIAKISKLSEEGALAKVGGKVSKLNHIDDFWAKIPANKVDDIKDAFTPNSATLRHTESEIVLYRHCSKGAPQLSNWYSNKILPSAQARIKLALPTSNTAERIIKVKVPKGTPYISGGVASQVNNPIKGRFGSYAIGQGEQIYFLDEHKSLIQVVEDISNPKNK